MWEQTHRFISIKDSTIAQEIFRISAVGSILLGLFMADSWIEETTTLQILIKSF